MERLSFSCCLSISLSTVPSCCCCCRRIINLPQIRGEVGAMRLLDPLWLRSKDNRCGSSHGPGCRQTLQTSVLFSSDSLYHPILFLPLPLSFLFLRFYLVVLQTKPGQSKRLCACNPCVPKESNASSRLVSSPLLLVFQIVYAPAHKPVVEQAL